MAIAWGLLGVGIVILGIVRRDWTLVMLGGLAMAHASSVARINGLELRNGHLG